MMPATPAATRSSITRCCTAAAACSGYLNCRLYLGSSPCAFLTPASAIFQKSDAPLTTNTSVFLDCALATPATVSATTNAAQAVAPITSAFEPSLMGHLLVVLAAGDPPAGWLHLALCRGVCRIMRCAPQRDAGGFPRMIPAGSALAGKGI